MIQPRTLSPTDDYNEALAAERAKQRPRFSHHVKALEIAAKVPPHGSWESPSVRNRRIAESTDKAHGYTVYLVFDLDPREFISHLRWIESYDL